MVIRQERPHAARERPASRPEEEVGVVRKEGPGVDGEHPTFRHGGEPGNEVFAVSVLFLDGAALEPPHHHMMEGVGRIEPSWSGRGRRGRR